MASVLHRSRDDTELARRVSGGDSAAFALLDARHRNALTRYAGSLLRRSEHDAEDVVQDVLIRAHDALRAGDVPDDLRPWLYRLTRNRAIDEVRRKRWGDESLDSENAFNSDRGADPATVLTSKETLRRLVEDLADLPVNQRVALLARELDDRSPEEVAQQLDRGAGRPCVSRSLGRGDPQIAQRGPLSPAQPRRARRDPAPQRHRQVDAGRARLRPALGPGQGARLDQDQRAVRVADARQPNSITLRMPSCACMSSKPVLTSSSVIRCERKASTSMSPSR